MTRVALATCAELPDLDEDGPALRAALAACGIGSEPAVWDDDAVDWARYDLVVIRSTWDYPPRRDAFLTWAESLPRVLNDPNTLRWNTDKHYLGELAAGGVSTIQTAFLAADEAFSPPAGEYVVKPAISAGSKDTARYGEGDHDRAAEHVAALQAQGRAVMVQPYLEAVDVAGETALLYLGGDYTHAIRKGPVLRPGAGLEEGLFAPEDISVAIPTPAQRALGDRAVELVRARVGPTLYGRVDVVTGPDGNPLVLEVELTEPSLYLGYTEGAAERLATLIAREAAR
jgi:glutathione synthase/RimK-type ligase-like ATP-grasp enzyme